MRYRLSSALRERIFYWARVLGRACFLGFYGLCSWGRIPPGRFIRGFGRLGGSALSFLCFLELPARLYLSLVMECLACGGFLRAFSLSWYFPGWRYYVVFQWVVFPCSVAQFGIGVFLGVRKKGSGTITGRHFQSKFP